MGRLRMTSEQVVQYLEDSLSPNYAHSFQVIADTPDVILLRAVAGDAEGLDNQILEYRVHRRIDYILEGRAFFMVEYRPKTGWLDQEYGDWRWATHIIEEIPNSNMRLSDALAYEGLQLNEEEAQKTLPWLNKDIMIYGVRKWLYGEVTPDLENPISYKSLLAIPNALEDIEE